jgi:hypothetical protein
MKIKIKKLGENKYKTQENLTNNNFIIERRTASSSMIQNRTREKSWFRFNESDFYAEDSLTRGIQANNYLVFDSFCSFATCS